MGKEQPERIVGEIETEERKGIDRREDGGLQQYERERWNHERALMEWYRTKGGSEQKW